MEVSGTSAFVLSFARNRFHDDCLLSSLMLWKEDPNDRQIRS